MSLAEQDPPRSPSEADRLNAISDVIIGVAIDIHRELGPGLLESVYETCLVHELRQRGHFVDQQKPMGLVYRTITIDKAYVLDLLVDGEVIVEVKAVEKLAPVHRAQLLTYLRLSGKKLGLLLNFDNEVLRDGIRRVVNGLAE